MTVSVARVRRQVVRVVGEVNLPGAYPVTASYRNGSETSIR